MRLSGVVIGIALLVAGVMIGCGGGRLRDIAATGEATRLYDLKRLTLRAVSLPGEEGEMFNALVQGKLEEKLASYLSSGSRWTLVILDVEYTEPHHSQRTPHYKLVLEAQLVDISGKRGLYTPEGIATPELVDEHNVGEEKVREHLVDAVVDALVEKLPLYRVKRGE